MQFAYLNGHLDKIYPKKDCSVANCIVGVEFQWVETDKAKNSPGGASEGHLSARLTKRANIAQARTVHRQSVASILTWMLHIVSAQAVQIYSPVN